MVQIVTVALRRVSLVLVLVFLVAPMLTSAAPAAAGSRDKCGKFSGRVVLTYANPDTIVLHILQGKVNAATPFTMTPQTVYQRNGQSATFADINIGDAGTITATEQLPSGVLLACTVTMTGP